MATIMKRTTSAPTHGSVAPAFSPPCHYMILRHPIKDEGMGTFHEGPEPSGILTVYRGAIPVYDGMSAESLFQRIVESDHWFIRSNPGRYSVVSSVFGMSFTFLVLHDGTYNKGWEKWPDFLREAQARGVQTF